MEILWISLADYLRMILHLDIFQFNRMLESCGKKTGQVETMLVITGYLDMAISVGGFRKSLEGYCIPKLEEDTEKLSAYEEGLASAVVTAGEKQYPGGQREFCLRDPMPPVNPRS